MIENNSILSLASDLKLKSFSTITLFDGAVVIAKDGTITTQGTLIAQGGIKTNEIRPINDNENVSVELNYKLQNPNDKLYLIIICSTIRKNAKSNKPRKAAIIPEKTKIITKYLTASCRVGQETFWSSNLVSFK